MSDGIPGMPWTRLEIEATVAAYFRMRDLERVGRAYKKSDVIRQLMGLMPARNSRAIESKFQNISAILDELGELRIEGYKPLTHYQHSLREAVVEALDAPLRVREVEEAYEATALVAPSTRQRSTEDVLVVAPSVASSGARRRSSVTLTGGDVVALRDFKRRELGRAGEAWVVDLERESLRRAGREDLAARVEWSARVRGDGLGYDITSFRPDGSDRLIEVKTTNLGPKTPFYITRWELDVSRENAAKYALYRVHGFARDPRIYVLDGDVERLARLDPRVFLGIPI